MTSKVIVVTGGASGIGRECAQVYTREGAQAVVADVDLVAAEQTAEEIGGGCAAVRCDVADRASVDKAFGQVLMRFGRVDAVHNNAGIVSPSKPLQETTEDEWDRLLVVNLKSVYLTAVASFDALCATRGSILNTASLVGLIGQSNHAAYAATKGGMIALTKAMALDFAPFGVRVNAVCPSGVWTPMLRQWVSAQHDPIAAARQLDEIHPLGYCPEADVVADVCAFLISDKARFMTGAIIPVTGGAELGYRR